ncbi:MAG: glycoside hydrolase family 57 protein [Bacteroidota bacterium]
MRSLCLNFQVHQPYRLRTYRFFDIGDDHYYYDDYLNRTTIRRIAERSYIPANNLLLKLIKEWGPQFKVSFSISGIALEQMERFSPETLDSFKKLAKTGCVEFLAETYSHSLASLKNKDEFKTQVEKHASKIESLFGQKPVTFRNSEHIYSDNISEMVADMGYTLMLTEGAKHFLGWKSPNFMYCSAANPKLKLLLRNFNLSDDLAFRFSNTAWSEWPLTAEKFANWIKKLPANQEVVNLSLGYASFGEIQPKESGIFEFLQALPKAVIKNSGYTFNTPAELNQALQPVAAVHVPFPASWADEERDVTAWLGNELQQEAVNKLYSLSGMMQKCSDVALQNDWNYLQSSDHFYYMSTKVLSDGEVHSYFNPYGSPYEAFINYMNVLSDFTLRIEHYQPTVIIPAEPEVKKITKKTAAKKKAVK